MYYIYSIYIHHIYSLYIYYIYIYIYTLFLYTLLYIYIYTLLYLLSSLFSLLSSIFSRLSSLAFRFSSSLLPFYCWLLYCCSHFVLKCINTIYHIIQYYISLYPSSPQHSYTYCLFSTTHLPRYRAAWRFSRSELGSAAPLRVLGAPSRRLRSDAFSKLCFA